jgi:hypothetical protein
MARTQQVCSGERALGMTEHTYIRLTEAIIAGTADAPAFQLTFSAQVRRRIRQRAEDALATSSTGRRAVSVPHARAAAD